MREKLEEKRKWISVRKTESERITGERNIRNQK